MKITLNNLEDTEKLAEDIASLANVGDIIALTGDLGAGKTAFSRAFINSFLDGEHVVTSPTFNIVQIYKGAPQDSPSCLREGARGRAENVTPPPSLPRKQGRNNLQYSEIEIWHADLYRIEDIGEISELGIESMPENALLLVEWPEIAGDILSKNRLNISLQFGESENSRIVEINNCEGWNERISKLGKI